MGYVSIYLNTCYDLFIIKKLLILISQKLCEYDEMMRPKTIQFYLHPVVSFLLINKGVSYTC